MSGWIKLQRKMIDWEWFTDVNTCHLFTYLLLAATHTTVKWRGILLEPGQLITGRTLLATKTGLSEQQVRTSLDKLKSTNEITSESTNNFTVITITNWNLYQDINQPSNQPITSQITNEQPANQPTDNHIQEGKENKNEKKIIKDMGDFENFWNVYGYKIGKADSKKVYERILKKGVTHETIIDGVRRYQAHCQRIGTGGKHIKHPKTYLNGEHWTDEYPEFIVSDKAAEYAAAAARGEARAANPDF